MVLDDGARRFILAEARRAGRPVLTVAAGLVAQGALASHGPDLASVGQQIVEAVRRIEAGESPAQIGLLLPRGQLTVNRRMAERLRLSLRTEVLARSVEAQ